MGNGCDELPPSDNEPRSMRDPDVRARRKALLKEPHMRDLAKYADELRNREGFEVPDFDPCDGGTKAQVLFLFEKPGPKTSEANGGSGFISRNNDDPTAKNTFKFMEAAGIPRKLTVTWNVIPWWNGTRNITAAELREGVASVKELMKLLEEHLRAVVLVGKQSARSRYHFEDAGLAIFTSAHPARMVQNRYPKLWKAIPGEWAKVKKFINIKKLRG